MSSTHEVSPGHRDTEVPSSETELPSYENVVQQPSDHHLHPDSAIHDEKSHPAGGLHDSKNAPTHTTIPMPDENGFGKDAKVKAQEYHSDQIYPENRYGELGRADSTGAVPMLSDKIKGTARQFVGKITGNQELHDKGVRRKSLSPMPS